LLTFINCKYIIKITDFAERKREVDNIKTLSEVRNNKKLTLEKLAGDIDIPVSTYYLYETGKRKIPAEVVEKLCKRLRLSKANFFVPSTFAVRKAETG
jgi:transcriptional regulator with XRE-family HTH domain